MFDLPSMLGEYLLPLIILVPLAVLVVLVVTRQQKEEPWQQRRAETLTPPPRAPGRAPTDEVAPEMATVNTRAATPTEPAAFGPAMAYAPTEPAALGPATPFVAALDMAPPPSTEAPSPPPAPPAPAVTPRRRASDVLPSPPAPVDGPLPLLVVDDSAVVRAKLSKLLGGAGYAVTLARHGQEAIEQLDQRWFAMMITDLEMPEMDGFELIAHVSNDLRTENLPIVAITGHEALQAKVQDARGLYGIFKKPWNDRELLARVGVLAQLRPRA